MESDPSSQISAALTRAALGLPEAQLTEGEAEVELWTRQGCSSKLEQLRQKPPRAVELQKKVQQLLNKVCPENVRTIAEQLADVKVSSSDELAFVCGIIFKRAQLDPHYSDTLSDLLFGINAVWGEVPSSDSGGRSESVREVLTRRCQAEFEALPASFEASPEEHAAYDVEELEHRMQERKKQVLAFMKLIGSMFLRALLSPAVVVGILQDLIHANPAAPVPSELEIECACTLLCSVGSALQEYKGGRYVSSLCHRLTRLRQAKTADGKADAYKKRLQFMIKDVVDLRDAQWVQNAFKTTAKTKDDIRKDADAELLSKQHGEDGVLTTVVGKRPDSVIGTKVDWTPCNSPLVSPTPSNGSPTSRQLSKLSKLSDGHSDASPRNRCTPDASPRNRPTSDMSPKGNFLTQGRRLSNGGGTLLTHGRRLSIPSGSESEQGFTSRSAKDAPQMKSGLRSGWMYSDSESEATRSPPGAGKLKPGMRCGRLTSESESEPPRSPQKQAMKPGQRNTRLMTPKTSGTESESGLSQMSGGRSTRKKFYMCKYITQGGTCPNGDTCQFAHSRTDLSCYKTKLCKNFPLGACKHADECIFAHGDEELQRYRDELTAFRTKICKDYVSTGSCAHGIDCIFAHGEDELKRPCSSIVEQAEDASPRCPSFTKVVVPLPANGVKMLLRSLGTLEKETGAYIEVNSGNSTATINGSEEAVSAAASGIQFVIDNMSGIPSPCSRKRETPKYIRVFPTDPSDTTCPETNDTEASVASLSEGAQLALSELSDNARCETNRWTRRRLGQILEGLILDVGAPDRRAWSAKYNERLGAIQSQLDADVFKRNGADGRAICPKVVWCEMRSSLARLRNSLECSTWRALDGRRRHEEALEKSFWEALTSFAQSLPEDPSLWSEANLVGAELYDEVRSSVKKISKSMSWLLGSAEQLQPRRGGPTGNDETKALRSGGASSKGKGKTGASGATEMAGSQNGPATESESDIGAGTLPWRSKRNQTFAA
jgi:hypothetical protein